MNTRTNTILKNLKDEVLNSNKKILFVTGAGLSLDSGIPLFRTDSNENDNSAIWNSELESWATINSFRNDPYKWYSVFRRQFKYWSCFITAQANEGHRILSKLCIENPNRIKIITQNIDGLMQQSNCPSDCLIEIHGRIEYLRCVNLKCDYSNVKYIKIDWNSIVHNGQIPKSFYRNWVCSLCKSPLLPLFLLFDESYTSHSYYQWEKAQKWMQEAEIMIFIGTSFSVLCTDYCLCNAYKNKIPIYNVNIRSSPIYFELNTSSDEDFEIIEYPSDLTYNIIKTSTDFLKILVAS